MKTLLKASCVLALVAALTASVAHAITRSPTIFPLRSAPYGMTHGEWGDASWQWLYSFPFDTYPALDTTGEFAALGQSGQVWFLAPSFSWEPVERAITIPAGKALFVPIFGAIWVNVEELGDAPWSDAQEAYARGLVASIVDEAAGSFVCQIDGVPVLELASRRSSTAPDGEFMLALPENNVWGLPPGVYGPSVQDGVYLMLPPLPPGQHTIYVHVVASEMETNVTYHITVGD